MCDAADFLDQVEEYIDGMRMTYAAYSVTLIFDTRGVVCMAKDEGVPEVLREAILGRVKSAIEECQKLIVRNEQSKD